MVTETKTRKVEPDITVVEISGRLNLGNQLLSIENSIRHRIDEGAHKMVIDLSGLAAIDSSGVGTLVGCFAHMEQNRGHLRIAGAQGSVAKVFAMVHMDRITPLDADAETSCRQLAASKAAESAG
jgi:anti-sigma B factor antagonist